MCTDASASGPCSRCSCARNRTTRCAATWNPSVSKIWLPMWLCSPTSVSASAFNTRWAASAASLVGPPVIEKPNFWSSCAVAMNSWVCASTPTVSRIITGTVAPRSRATASSRAISCSESTTTYPTPASTAATSSSIDLLLPWNAIRSRREARPQRDRELATAADVQAQPLVGDPAGDLRAQERLGGVVHRPRAERGGELRRTRPEVGLVDDEERCAVPLREVADVHAAQHDHAVVAAAGTARPHRGGQRVEVGGAARVRACGLGRVQHTGVQRTGGMGVHCLFFMGRVLTRSAPSQFFGRARLRAARARSPVPGARRPPVPAAPGAGP